MNHLTLGHSLALISTAGVAWLMVRLGLAKRRLELRVPVRCASCGRRLTGKTCSCAD
jgi:hypothetical protein